MNAGVRRGFEQEGLTSVPVAHLFVPDRLRATGDAVARLFGKQWAHMSDPKPRAVAESVFNRNQKREAEINDALQQEGGSPYGRRQEHASLTSVALGARDKSE